MIANATNAVIFYPTTPIFLDADDTVNVGGQMGILCDDHLLEVGEEVFFAGTSFDSATAYVLQATTTPDMLVINKAYTDYTHTGDEVVNKAVTIDGVRCDIDYDADGNWYMPCLWSNPDRRTKLLKFDSDFVSAGVDFFQPSVAWVGSGVGRACCVSSDSQYVYHLEQAGGVIRKFRTDDGTEEWMVSPGTNSSDIDLDENDNVYAGNIFAVGGGDRRLIRYNAADGAEGVLYTDTVMITKRIFVDDDLGMVVACGTDLHGPRSNVVIRTLDDSSGAGTRLNSTPPTGVHTLFSVFIR
jgi:hypothetical protein